MNHIMASINSLDEACLQLIYRSLGPLDLARGMCVAKFWHSTLSDERLWKQTGKDVWGLSTPMKPLDDEAETFKEAVGSWEAAALRAGRYVSRVDFLRLAKAWMSVRTFYAPHPHILATLRRGVKFEPDERMPREICAFMEITSGQHDCYVRWQGILGGCCVYNIWYTTVLKFPENRPIEPPTGAKTYLLGAASDASNGFRCGPNSVVWSLGNRLPFMVPGCPEGKTFVDWLEEFGVRLSEGCYEMSNEVVDYNMPLVCPNIMGNKPYLYLFSWLERLGARTETTEGVKISVSSLLLPHHSPHDKWLFAYSVKMSLEAQENRGSRGQGRESVKLLSRHWSIMDAAGRETEAIDGPGVIGEFPELQAGGKTFQYQSCMYADKDASDYGRSGEGLSFSIWNSIKTKAYMEGYFTFEDAYGERIKARCPRFELRLPDYIF